MPKSIPGDLPDVVQEALEARRGQKLPRSRRPTHRQMIAGALRGVPHDIAEVLSKELTLLCWRGRHKATST